MGMGEVSSMLVPARVAICSIVGPPACSLIEWQRSSTILEGRLGGGRDKKEKEREGEGWERREREGRGP